MSEAIETTTAPTGGPEFPSIQPPDPGEGVRPSEFREALRKQDELARQQSQNPKPQQPPKSAREHVQETSDRILEAKGQQPEGVPEREPQEGQEAPEGQEQQEAPGLQDEDALTKFREWETSPDLPEEFNAKLVEVPNGPHATKLVTVDEMRKGYMRMGDSTRLFQQAKALETQQGDREKVYSQHFEAIHDPDQFLQIYERNGYGDTLMKVAEKLARRVQEDDLHVRAAGKLIMEQHGLPAEDYRVREAMEQTRAARQSYRNQDAENAKIRQENERLRQARQEVDSGQETKALADEYRAQLAQLVPISFKALGIKDDQVNRAKHLRYLTELMQIQKAGSITRTIAMEAATMVREELDDTSNADRARETAAPPQNGTGKALGPTRLGTGTGQRRDPTTNGESARISDFRSVLAEQDRLRRR